MNINEVQDSIQKSKICNEILRALPNWFGIESAIVDYVKSVAEMKFWSIDDENNNSIGFIAICKHNPDAAEIHVMGILDKYHKLGYGKKLIQAAEMYLADNKVKYLSVKTLSDSHSDVHYAKTRKFYLNYGFVPLEEFKNLWGEHNPCLYLIKNIEINNLNYERLVLPDYKFNSDLKEIPTEPKELEEFIKINQEQLKSVTNLNEKRHYYENLSFAYRITNQLDFAETYLKKALALSINNINHQIQNSIRLAHVYQWQREFKKSMALFDQAKALINEHDAPKQLFASYYQHLGKFYFDQKFYGLAACQFEAALKIRTDLNVSLELIESTRSALNESRLRGQMTDVPYIIRPALLEDAESIHNAHMRSINEVCGKDYSAEELRVWGGRSFDMSFRKPGIQNQFYLVVELENKIVGFCQLKARFVDGIKQAHLFGLYLTPEIIGHGVGQKLLNLVFEHCRHEEFKKITLMATITALNFYKKNGFIQLGEITGIVMDGVSVRSHKMEKVL